MKKSSRRALGSVLILCLIASFFSDVPLGAQTAPIDVKIGEKTVSVTPGKWVTVPTESGSVTYNIREVNGKPVALTEEQYRAVVTGTASGTRPAEAKGVTPVSSPFQTNSQSPVSYDVEDIFGRHFTLSPEDLGGFTPEEIARGKRVIVKAGVKIVVKKIQQKTGTSSAGSKTAQTTTTTPESKLDKLRSKFDPDNIKGAVPKDGQSRTDLAAKNAKSSIKDSLSAKNLGITALVTVGSELGTQIINGEDIDVLKAVKTLCTVEFLGSTAGSTLGAAAGSAAVPFLASVPYVGGFLAALAPTFGSLVGGEFGGRLAGDAKDGKVSLSDTVQKMDWVGITGQTIGSVVGGAIGSLFFPPFGTIVGSMVGGFIGKIVAHKIADALGKDKKPVPIVSKESAREGTTSSGVSSSSDGAEGTPPATSSTIVGASDSQKVEPVTGREF